MARSIRLPAFGERQLEVVTTSMIERWVGSVELSAGTGTKWPAGGRLRDGLVD